MAESGHQLNMKSKKKQTDIPNVTWRELLLALFVILILMPIFWFDAAGKRWAAIMLGAIPVLAYIYWLIKQKDKR